METRFYVSEGETAEFSKTLTESDLAMFSAISGDFDPIHVDEEYARTSPFGRRIAHGILSMALLSTTSAMITRRALERGNPGVAVSMGYDKIRFLKPVFVGDTLTAKYAIESLDGETRRSLSKVEVVNQHQELCVVGQHVMKWLPPRET